MHCEVPGAMKETTDDQNAGNTFTAERLIELEKEKFLNCGSWEINLKTQEISWSDGKYRLFGYDPKSNALPPVTLDLYRQHITAAEFTNVTENWELFLGEREAHTWEYEATTVTGLRVRLETFGRMIRDGQGSPIKVIGASRDVTRIREYEESLNQKIYELDRSNKELEEFAYIASHDLQEPLRKITAFSERLKDRSASELGAEGAVYLNRMLVATENMRILIDNLLEFSRTSRHNQPFVKLDLNTVLAEVRAELELKIEETNANIEAGQLPEIEGIPSQIQQLFINLISNAIKFRKPGISPQITLSSVIITRQDKEQFRLSPEKKYHKFILRDEGIGFEKEYSVKIFQIFQRLHGKSEYPGSGIGLAICKKIAENHQGLIYAESEPDKGSSFIIILPESQH